MNRGQRRRASAARRRRCGGAGRRASSWAGSMCERPSQTVLVGDLPQWAATRRRTLSRRVLVGRCCRVPQTVLAGDLQRATSSRRNDVLGTGTHALDFTRRRGRTEARGVGKTDNSTRTITGSTRLGETMYIARARTGYVCAFTASRRCGRWWAPSSARRLAATEPAAMRGIGTADGGAAYVAGDAVGAELIVGS